MQGRESAGQCTHDNEIAAKIKTQFYKDPIVKGTQVDVNVLNGVAQLGGFVDSQQAKDRAGEIAQNTKDVTQVYNNLILPTGRMNDGVGEACLTVARPPFFELVAAEVTRRRVWSFRGIPPPDVGGYC